jgi:hypothetical protein
LRESYAANYDSTLFEGLVFTIARRIYTVYTKIKDQFTSRLSNKSLGQVQTSGTCAMLKVEA